MCPGIDCGFIFAELPHQTGRAGVALVEETEKGGGLSINSYMSCSNIDGWIEWLHCFLRCQNELYV